MKLIRTLNNFNYYDIKLVEEKDDEKDNHLLIYLSYNEDLYMSISNNERLDSDEDGYRWIDINKDDTDIYNIFDRLYNSVLEKSKLNKDILDEDNNIVWTSDEGRKEVEDSLIIFRYDDFYRLLFHRNNKHKEKCSRRKSSRSIDIRFSTSGSRYKEFVSSFLTMYRELNEIEKPKVYKKGD
jgi:hypothetical protein